MQRVGVTAPSLAALYVLSCLLSSCSVYDADRITAPGQPLEGQPSAAGIGAGRDAGPSMQPEPAESMDASTEATDARMPNPIPIDATHCGDGRVTGEEKCDVAIAAGTPGACPTTCPELAPCNPRALNNSGCQAECVLLQLVCKDDDGCCPGNCTDKNDADCSSNCGDGIVQTEDGETCESESTTPCKSSDAQCDDMDVCTVDKLIGSPQNCNALCTNTRITDAKDGDGCCPTGSDANSDKDCMPVCGNKIREAGEDCDGSEGCSPQCRLSMLQMNQMRCLEKFAADGDECARCSCMNCSTSYLACRESADTNANMLCNAVLDCAREKDCYGGACYCGEAFLCSPPSGQCVMQIEAAAGTNDPLVVNTRAVDPMYAIGRAYTADMCRMTQCPEQCRR